MVPKCNANCRRCHLLVRSRWSVVSCWDDSSLQRTTDDGQLTTSMAQTKHQIEAILSEAGTHPRHRFGQNFMIDQNLVRLVADAGELGKDDWVVEVGPGTGTLTEELVNQAGNVVAVEIDRDLAQTLRQRFSDQPN